MTRWGRTGLLVAVLLTAAGCAERGVVSRPPSTTGTGTWVAVAIAAGAIVLVLAALIVLPAWRPGGSGFAAGLLGLQAGGVVVGSAVLVGAALRGATLEARGDVEQAASLLHLSGLDGGDAGFFRVIAVLTVVLGALVVAVLVLAARFAADVDPVERTLACCVLAVESLISGLAVVLGLLGHHSLPFALTAAALPAIVLAIVKCWPHREAEDQELGYNGAHG